MDSKTVKTNTYDTLDLILSILVLVIALVGIYFLFTSSFPQQYLYMGLILIFLGAISIIFSYIRTK